MTLDEEERRLRAVALQNAESIQRARQRAEAELIRTREELRETAGRLRATFEQAAVGMALIELDGRFLQTNGKFRALLGYSEEELCRLNFREITHPEDLPANESCIRRLLAGEVSDFRIEKRYRCREGALLWSLTTVTLLKDAAGRGQRFIAVIEDIGERKRMEEALRQAAEERKALLERERAARRVAERMSATKDEFLATLSHELRTPLSAILGWSQMLRRLAESGGDLDKGLDVIERNARVQTQLIEDLLDMSRINAGKLRLDVQPVVPFAFIEAALETVRPAAIAKGVRLEVILDPVAGPVMGDPDRLQQVVWNLLSNAIKFTPRDGRVQLLLRRVNSQIEITVADTGIGIRPEFLPQVFDRFRQGDASSTRRYGGLGLGLAIVRHLVELHGGTVRASSEGEARGAIFTVSLPLTPLRLDALQAARTLPALAELRTLDLSGIKVLVVDDEGDARELLRRVLLECRAEVILAGNAAEALRAVEHDRPHVLVSDIGMPDVDGLELLRRVRALGEARGGRVPAIALTAFARSEDRTRALRAGFLVHVSKPVEPSELIATVASVAGRAEP